MRQTFQKQFVPHVARRRRFFIISTIVVLIALFSISTTRVGILKAFAYIGMPFARISSQATTSIDEMSERVHTKKTLIAENDALQSQVAELEVRLRERDMLVHELADLKAIFNREGSSSFTLASIISKPPHSPYGTLTIDGGSLVGIKDGQIVYADGRTPIGVIDGVMEKSAIVRLYAFPGERTMARLSPANLDIELIGKGGGNFIAIVPHDFVVAPETVAVTKELNSRIVAYMQEIISDDREPEKTILFTSPANVLELSFVQVKQ